MNKSVVKKPGRRVKVQEQLPMDDSDWSLQKNIAYRMACVSSRMDQDLRDTVLRNLDLTYVHFRVLQVLYESDGQMIGDIARTIVVRQPALSRVIDQMEERELVRREANPEDSRYIQVWLTWLGRSRYEEAWPSAHSIVERALTVVTTEERQLLLDILIRMDSHLQR